MPSSVSTTVFIETPHADLVSLNLSSAGDLPGFRLAYRAVGFGFFYAIAGCDGCCGFFVVTIGGIGGGGGVGFVEFVNVCLDSNGIEQI